jgi:O-antigen/teichoic acid export membrane protein
MWCVIIAGLINITLNILFVPKFGYYAAAWSTLAGYAVMLSLMVYFSRKFFRWPFPFMTLLKSGVSSIIMGVVVYFIWSHFYFLNNYINVFVDVIIGVIVYSCCVLWIQEITNQERKIIWEFIRKTLPN